MLYDRPVSALMGDFAAQVEGPFKPAAAVGWFALHYPDVRSTTVRAHVIGLTENDTSRHHYNWLAAKPALFRKLPGGQLVTVEGSEPPADGNVDELLDGEVEEDQASGEGRMEFALEAYLEEFLLTNWDLIDWGRRLAIWEGPNGEDGHQFAIPVGRLDFLAIDLDTNALVAIELKRGRPSDRVVGQTARYMGWLREELASEGQAVEGLVVAGEADPKLYYSALAVPGLSVLLYDVSFGLRPAVL